MKEEAIFQENAKRYLSLDVLRGLTVALMIVVNNPGSWSSIYPQFEHSEWHGFTLTDLVFPTFLFVGGNALGFSMKKLKEVSISAFLKKVLKRTLIIFGIGLFLNIFPFVYELDGHLTLKNILDIRIWGVLQRIAICYLFASLMIYYFRRATLIALSIFFLLLYWVVLYYFGDARAPYSLQGNAVLKFGSHLDKCKKSL
ncbi:MAG TPA: heparan-alpha-glucosaminide N-acetyltransferase domain-containing protein [Pelobium sp.]|nr:heparan-alpha-glucosaminide N-acetyltransferase domain-containing protein [Pelobium sp.]